MYQLMSPFKSVRLRNRLSPFPSDEAATSSVNMGSHGQAAVRRKRNACSESEVRGSWVFNVFEREAHDQGASGTHKFLELSAAQIGADWESRDTIRARPKCYGLAMQGRQRL